MVFIGHIIRFAKGKIYGSFLRSEFTKTFTGYVYSYPPVKDRASFKFDQIVSIIQKPKRFLRGHFLFNIHQNRLATL